MYRGKRLALLGISILGMLVFAFLSPGLMAVDEAQEEEVTAFMGVSVTALSRQEKADLGLKWGVRIRSIERKSAADKAGLELDDILLTVEGEKLRCSQDLVEIVSEHKPGDQVNVEIQRDKQKKTLKVVLGERKAGRHFLFRKLDKVDWPNIWHKRPDMVKRAFLGVSVEDIEGDFAAYFGLKGEKGVLIRTIEKDGPADKGGLKAGDVLQKIGEDKISQAAQVQEILGKMKAGEKVAISILRHGKSQKLTVELGERDMTGFLKHFRWNEGPFPKGELDGIRLLTPHREMFFLDEGGDDDPSITKKRIKDSEGEQIRVKRKGIHIII